MKKQVLLLLIIFQLYSMLAEIIDDLEFSWYSQVDERWKYENLGYSRYNTIGRSGCVLTCLSMLFNSEASNPNVTPEELNAWLVKNNGYAHADMRWEIVAQFDGVGEGVELVGQCNRRNDWKFISEHLEKGNKVITKVGKGRGHWVLIVGKNGQDNKAASYEVNDPGLPAFKKRTLAHWGGFRAARAFSGNWVTRDQLKMNSNAKILAADSLDVFMYSRYEVNNPADLYVSIENNLKVAVNGYFTIGLYNQDNQFISTIGLPTMMTITQNESKEVLFSLEKIDQILNSNYQIKLIYAKSLDSSGKPQNALVLNPTGLNTFSFTKEEMDFVTDN
ncbi:MAG: C39 family peptidase [Candidatus Cloacimonetes bacterium]|nr:C39 family peptidase [Candidatus Cloacimonadota bacterium]